MSVKLTPHELSLVGKATGLWEKQGMLPSRDDLRLHLKCRENSAGRILNHLKTISSTVSTEELRDFDVAAKKFRELISKKDKPASPPKQSAGSDKVYAVFSDLHAPHFDLDLVSRAVREAKRRGATRAVMPGDLFDCFGFSRFAKFEHVPIQDELAAGTLFLQMLSENFEKVDVIPGNHDDRVKKYFAKFVPPEFMFLVRWNLIDIVSADMPNVNQPIISADGRDVPFLWRSGDLVLGHPETSSKVLIKPVDSFANWLVEWRNILNFDEVKVVGQGHTHRAGGPVMRPDGIAVFELGCLCRLPDYAFDPKLRFHPQQNAYSIFVQRDGKTDLNESRLFFL